MRVPRVASRDPVDWDPEKLALELQSLVAKVAAAQTDLENIKKTVEERQMMVSSR